MFTLLWILIAFSLLIFLHIFISFHLSLSLSLSLSSSISIFSSLYISASIFLSFFLSFFLCHCICFFISLSIILILFFKKVGHSRPLFIYFRLFSTVNKQMFNINFANDWSRTIDLWYWKWPLYQLSHNHFPSSFWFFIFLYFSLYLFRCLKYGPNLASFCLFSIFSQHNQWQIKYKTWLPIRRKIIDGLLGIRTRDRRMVGTDESTDLWGPHYMSFFISLSFILTICLSLPLYISFLPVSLSVCLSLSLCLSVSLSLCVSLCLSVSLSVCLSVSLSLCLSVSLSLFIYISLSFCLSLSLYLYLSFSPYLS